MKWVNQKKGRAVLAVILLSVLILMDTIQVGSVTRTVKKVSAATVSEVVELDEGVLEYGYAGRTCIQIPCEEKHGIYFLNEEKLTFYDMDAKKNTLVHVFRYNDNGADKKGTVPACYVVGNTLYVMLHILSGVQVQSYDLIGQSVQKIIPVPADFCTALGVDAEGRIYAGNSDVIYLLDNDGNVLDQASTGWTIYNIAGFDSTNGNFYMESYANWRYWGYDHDMSVLRMGNVSNGKITINADYNVMLGQKYYSDRERQLEVVNDRYILADSGMYSNLYVFDSHKYTSSSEGQTVSIYNLIPNVDNALIAVARDNKDKDGKFDRNAAVGTRAVYMPDMDSLVSYVDGASLKEYDLQTKAVIAEVTTAHPVFSLMRYGNYVVAVERENDKYYIEKFLWKRAGVLTITNKQASLKVGESITCEVESDGTLNEIYTWSTSDSKIASVSEYGTVTACQEGKAVISVKTNFGASVSWELTVAADEGIKNPSPNALRLSGKATDNMSKNNYTVWSKVMNSYLIENKNGTLTRVECNGGNILLETYKKGDGKMEDSVSLPFELDVFGGFYAGNGYNYLVFGCENPSEDNAIEVMRVVKYSKSWERLSAASFKGCNTYIPFDAGCLRMTEENGRLYIHTCHEMYASSGGIHHQANMTYVIDIDSMMEEQSYYDILNIAQAGYVSHSFNQFIRTNGKYVYRVDHGDSGPRGISITACKTDGKITDVRYTIPISFKGIVVGHYNNTGASIGGFELSAANCLIAGNGVDFEHSSDPSDVRNVYVSVTGKNLGASSLKWLTNYTEDSGITVRTPQLVKIDDERFLMLWEERESQTGMVRTAMVTLDGGGNTTSEIVRTNCRLSDCQPICCSDGVVRWYVSDGKACTMYQVHPLLLTQVNVPVASSSPAASVKPTAKPTVRPTALPTATVKPTVKPIALPTATVAHPTASSSGKPMETVRPLPDDSAEPPQGDEYEYPDRVDEPSGDKESFRKGEQVADRETEAVYRITGTGADKAVQYVKSMGKRSKTVIIPATVMLQGSSYKVTSVGDRAFAGNSSLQNVMIGSNVKAIGRQAFSGCKKLWNVFFGKNVTTIGDRAFSQCTGLTGISIPKRVNKIGEKAFYQCRKLSYIMVNTKKLSSAKIGKNAFGKGCRKPNVVTKREVRKRYSKMFLKKGMSKKAVFKSL